MIDPHAQAKVVEQYASQYGARSAARYDWSMREVLFAGVDLVGKSVLDVGAGNGHMGMWAAANGATRVVGLEPEDAGSSAGMQATFRKTAEAAGLQDRVSLIAQTIQEFDSEDRFDVLLLAASINHLDEEVCTRLHVDEGAREIYRGHLRRLAELGNPGAVVLVTDVARENLWGKLGITNPLARTIEWHKHQQPELWAELLADVGFVDPQIQWRTLNILRKPGIAVAGRRLAYVMASDFLLKMRLRAA